LLGHLGMTGRMYLAPPQTALPKHAAVVLDLGSHRFIYEDFRYFGRLTLDTTPLAALGPEPFSREFSVGLFTAQLKRSRQPIKVKLLDQSLVAGIGNIYASEALHLAGISPRAKSNSLSASQVRALHAAIRKVLNRAIRFGSTVPLNFSSNGGDGLFYYGSAEGGTDFYNERLLVYDRGGQPCSKCKTKIERIVQAARSTYFCPRCQPARGARAK
jgi:formamidopyrimidine-DNA glycosylase